MALRLFAAAGTAFLLALVSLGLSGGGLGHGVLPEPINSVVVVVTWLLWLALVPLLIAACVAAVIAIAAPRQRPSATDAGWPAQTFAGNTPVEIPALGSEPEPPRAQRQTGILVVLLIMTIGGVAIFLRAAERPAPDDVGLGLLLLGLGIVAWLVTVGTRAARFVLGLAQRYRMR